MEYFILFVLNCGPDDTAVSWKCPLLTKGARFLNSCVKLSIFILSSETGSVCMLKTGVKDGPTKGKSFYVCVEKRGCEFSQPARSVIQFNSSTKVHNHRTDEIVSLK